MTHVTCRLTTKNRDQLRNPTFGKPVLATFTFFTSDYLRYLKKTICNPLSHPTWKCTTLTCEVPKFFYVTEGLHCTCIFCACVFHPCSFVLAFSVLAFSSTCVFSAPCQLYRHTFVPYWARVDDRPQLKFRLHFAGGCTTSCTTGCITGWTKRFEYSYDRHKQINRVAESSVEFCDRSNLCHPSHCTERVSRHFLSPN